VLTTVHSGPLTFGVVLALYFSSSGIESLRIRVTVDGRTDGIALWVLCRMMNLPMCRPPSR
jgi:hypothetical protein